MEPWTQQLGPVGLLLAVLIGFWIRAEARADRQYQDMWAWNQKMVGALLESLQNVTKVLEKTVPRE